MAEPFRVDFMIVGAQKCGTTTLSEILRGHPSVTQCSVKEPHFFSKCENWRAELPRYQRLFESGDGTLRFEASTTYTSFPHENLEIWEDLYAFNAALKIVYLVRHPIQRVTSGYMHMYERGYTDLSFERALVELSEILDITRYATQIEPFVHRFGRDRLRIIFFEDLCRDPRAVAHDLARFLGIDPATFVEIDGLHRNVSVGGAKRHHKYDRPGWLLRGVRRFAPPLWRAITDNSARAFQRKPVLSPPYRRLVIHMLRSEIDRLEEITGRNLDHWRSWE